MEKPDTTGALEALSIQGFMKRYRSGTVAVSGMELSVPRGAFFGFLGPNGAGKTSTISCITGISYPSAGEIRVFGHDVVKEYRQARSLVGLSPQEFNVDIFAKTYKILDYMGGYYGLRKTERQERIETLLDQFDLRQYRDTEFRELSGGFKRRVLLARAMVHDPELLILDEPTAGVDVKLRHDLWRYLRRINDQGKTIILTSHYIEEVEALANEIAIINHGRIVARGTLADIVPAGKKLEDVYLEITAARESKA